MRKDSIAKTDPKNLEAFRVQMQLGKAEIEALQLLFQRIEFSAVEKAEAWAALLLVATVLSRLHGYFDLWERNCLDAISNKRVLPEGVERIFLAELGSLENGASVAEDALMGRLAA